MMLTDLHDDEVLQLTRFPRHGVEDICTLVERDIRHPTSRSHAIPVETQVLAALQFFGTGSYQWVIGRTCGLSQSSVCLAIDGVTRALIRHAPTYIQFSVDQQACRPYTVDVYLFIYLSSVGWLGFVVDIGRFWATVCETVVRPILSDR